MCVCVSGKMNNRRKFFTWNENGPPSNDFSCQPDYTNEKLREKNRKIPAKMLPNFLFACVYNHLPCFFLPHPPLTPYGPDTQIRKKQKTIFFLLTWSWTRPVALFLFCRRQGTEKVKRPQNKTKFAIQIVLAELPNESSKTDRGFSWKWKVCAPQRYTTNWCVVLYTSSHEFAEIKNISFSSPSLFVILVRLRTFKVFRFWIHSTWLMLARLDAWLLYKHPEVVF